MVLGVDAARRVKDLAGIQKVASEVEAGTLVRGTFYRQGDSLVFRVEAIDASTGDVRLTVDRVTAPVTDPMVAVRAIGERITGGLAVHRSDAGFNSVTRLRMPRIRSSQKAKSFFSCENSRKRFLTINALPTSTRCSRAHA